MLRNIQFFLLLILSTTLLVHVDARRHITQGAQASTQRRKSEVTYLHNFTHKIIKYVSTGVFYLLSRYLSLFSLVKHISKYIYSDVEIIAYQTPQGRFKWEVCLIANSSGMMTCIEMTFYRNKLQQCCEHPKEPPLYTILFILIPIVEETFPANFVDTETAGKNRVATSRERFFQLVGQQPVHY